MAKAKTHERRREAEKPATAPVAATPGFFQRNYREMGVCAMLAMAVWLVFRQIGSHGFINFDDWDYVGENLAVLSGITWEGVKFAFVTDMAANWHPVTWLSHMLDVQLFGVDPGAMHLASMWLHAANAVLLFVVLRYLTGALWRSAAVAALFAIHPLHVEPVAWLSDRKDLVATFFWLLTALTYGHWAKRGAVSWRWFALAHVWAALATMSKPTTVTLPFTLLLLDLWPLGRWENLPRRVMEKAGFFLLAVGQSVATFVIQRDAGATMALPDVSFGRVWANAIASYGVYLWQTVAPRNLTPLYPFPERIEWLPTIASAAAILGISWAVLRQLRQRPYLAAGWFWYAGVLLPMIGFVQVGLQAHADRYTYVPLIGIFWMVVWGLYERLGSAMWLRGVAVAVGILFMWASYAQAAFWVDDRTLFGHTLAVTRRNRLAHTVVGLSNLRAKNYEEAERHLRTALELDPKFMPAYRHMAEAVFAREKPEEALKLLDQAMALAPRAAVTYYNRGIVLRALGRNTEALADLEKAVKIGLDTDRIKRAHLEAGLIQKGEGKNAEALTYFQKALEVDPFYYLAEKNLAFTYYSMKDYEQAIYWFQQLQAIDPADEDVKRALASIKKR
jgi:tetratricopeptide (TPR) repeat protein